MRFSVLTFNTLGTPFFAPHIKKRYRKAAEMIEEQGIDIVCLQEVFSHYNRSLLDKALSDYPYRIYKKFIFGVYGGLAIYSKQPITFQEFYVYSYPKGLFIPPYTRLAHNGILIAKLDKIPLTIATTHLTSDEIHNVNPGSRYYEIIKCQAEQAAAILNKLSKEKNAVLMTGDFNISKFGSLYKQFLKTTGAVDIFTKDHTPTYAYDRIPYPFPAKTTERIDFMFYKEGKSKLKQVQTGHMFEDKVTFPNGKTGYLSDHIALKAEFAIK